MKGWHLIRLYTILFYLFMFLPIAVVVLLSFNPSEFGTFPMTGVSFRWFVALWNTDAIVRAFRVSILLGAMTAVISTTFGVMASLALVRYDFPGKGLLTTLLIAPILMPQWFGPLEGRAATWAPIGLVIVGGLTTSTFLTLMIIPTIYLLIDDLTAFVRRVVRAA